MEQIFIDNKDLQKAYKTSDGKFFYEADDAQNYAVRKALVDNGISIIYRDGSTKVFSENAQTTTPTPTPPTLTVNASVTTPTPTITLPYDEMDISKQKAFLFVSGQSNTERGQSIAAKSGSFFSNVKTLRFSNINDNVLLEDRWAWDNFSSLFTYNLGRQTSGNIHTQTYGIALGWQEAINSGAKLPDLHIIQVSHSSFGFSTKTGTGYRGEFGGFNPTYDENPSPIYTDVPIEKFWKFIPRVHRWAINNLIESGNVVRHLGLFWNQFEHDVAEGDPTNYKTMFSEFLKLFDKDAGFQIPLFHLYPRSPSFKTKPADEPIIQKAFDDIKAERPNVVSIDVSQNTSFDASDSKNGLYDDNYHYNFATTKDFIAKIPLDYFLGKTEVVGKSGSIRKASDFRNYGGMITQLIPNFFKRTFSALELSIIDKLKPSNRTGLGSKTTLGNVVNSSSTLKDLLIVVNTYLTTNLLASELDWILSNKNTYKWQIGVGDRRGGSAVLNQRLEIANNWSGDDVTELLLSPEPVPSSPFAFKLTFNSSTKKMKLTETHGGAANTYGGIRSLTISPV